MTAKLTAASLAMMDAISMYDNGTPTMASPQSKAMLHLMQQAALLASDSDTGDVLRALIRLVVRHAEAAVDPSEHRLMLMENTHEEMRAAVDTLLENGGRNLSGYWSNVA